MVREKALKEFKLRLSKKYDSKTINDLSAIFLMTLDNYELTERITEVGFLDTSNEMLLKNYAGTLLTEGKSENTVTSYIRALRNFADDRGKSLTEMTVSDVRVWLAQIQQKCSLRTCETYRSYLSAFYQYLTEEELIDKDPTSKVKPIKYEKKVKLSFTDVEVEALKNACRTPRERAEVELLLSSGIRANECVSLNINDIDFNNLTVLVRCGKGNKQRVTYIDEVCAVYIQKYLATRRDKDPSLFISRCNKRMSVRAIESDVKSIGKIAGVDNVHPHRFRRHFATNLYNKGMDIRTIQLLMGHTDINVTMQYISNSVEGVKNEYKKYN